LHLCYNSIIMELIRNSSDIGRVIKDRREALDRKPGDVARAAGIPRSTLARIENGQTSPTWGMVLALSQILDLQPVLVPREKMPAVDAVTTMDGYPETPPMAGDEW
jgi:transcriptional regulator with XRE-family HTH domain